MLAALPYQNVNSHMITNSGGGVIPSNHEVSIAEGSANPNSSVFYDPSPATVKGGNSVIWINNDLVAHTATSGYPNNEEAPTGTLFNTGIVGP